MHLAGFGQTLNTIDWLIKSLQNEQLKALLSSSRNKSRYTPVGNAIFQNQPKALKKFLDFCKGYPDFAEQIINCSFAGYQTPLSHISKIFCQGNVNVKRFNITTIKTIVEFFKNYPDYLVKLFNSKTQDTSSAWYYFSQTIPKEMNLKDLTEDNVQQVIEYIDSL